jgi:hypothetical protein
MDSHKFDKLVETYFADQEDHLSLQEAFTWLARKIWLESTYSPRHKEETDRDVIAEAVLVCFERRKKWGWNQRGKTACEFFAWIINTVYRHHCSWDKNKKKNGLKVKKRKYTAKPKSKSTAKETVDPAEAKRWGTVRQSGWKPKTGLEE